MDPLRIAVVGLGMGMNRARIVSRTPGAELVAVADLIPARRERAVEAFGCLAYDSFEALMQQADTFDCLYVMTESGKHADMGMAAARAGKHVISTKPLDISVDKCVEFCRTCDECGVILICDFQMRYTEAVQKLRAAVRQGALGRPLFGQVTMKWWRGEDYYEGWHGTWALDGGGSVMNQAIHFIDVLQYAMGAVDEVFAYSGVHAHVNCETEDMTNALLRFAGGAEGMIHTSTCFRGKDYDRVEINGTAGAAAVEFERITRWEFIPPEGRQEAWDAQTGARREGEAAAYEPELELPTTPASAAADMVQAAAGGESFCPGWSGIAPVALGLSLYQSAREGRPVRPVMDFGPER